MEPGWVAARLFIEPHWKGDETTIDHPQGAKSHPGTGGLRPWEVVGAAVFSTLDPNAQLLKLAAWAETLPEPVLKEDWEVREEYESYQVLAVGTYEVPVIQHDERPYSKSGEGRIAGAKTATQKYVRIRMSNLPRPYPNRSARRWLSSHHLHAWFRGQLVLRPSPGTARRGRGRTA